MGGGGSYIALKSCLRKYGAISDIGGEVTQDWEFGIKQIDNQQI